MELRGKTILITRASAQSQSLRDGLEVLGARVLECPTIEIVPVDDWSEVDQAIGMLSTYDWLIFTSTNAVTHFMPRVTALNATCAVPIAVVGPSTARKLEEWNLAASKVPADFRAEGLLDIFPKDLHGVRILIPRAEKGRELLPEELRRRGAVVDVLTVYRTQKAQPTIDLRAMFLPEAQSPSTRSHEKANEKIDVVVFMSPSAIHAFAEAAGDDLNSFLAEVPIAVIGPVARQALEALGLKVTIQPSHALVEELIESIRSYFRTSAGRHN